MPTGAQLIVDLLEDRGVEVCFGLPGVHNLALWEALRDSPIRLVGVRHEQAAAYAADGYARATGRLGVALTTTGPGAANTLGAVGEAWAARSPVLVIATDIPSTLRRPDTYRGVLHETTDQAAMFAPVVKAAHRALAAGEVGAAAAAALRDALRRRTARSTWRSPPTCSAPTCRPTRAGRRRRAAPPEPRARGRRRAARRRRAAAAVGGHGRARRGRRGAAAGRAAGGAGHHHLRRGRACCRRRTRAWSGMPPHVEPVGALWDDGRPRRRHRLGPRRRADPELRDAAAAGADRRQPRRRGRGQELPRRLPARGRRRGGRPPRWPTACRTAAASSALAERLHGVRARACSELDGRALRFLDAIALRAARGRGAGGRHVHPRLLAGRLPHAGRPAPAADPARLGHARLRLPGRDRRRARRRAARRSRWRATAASCSRAASWPRSRRSGSRSRP